MTVNYLDHIGGEQSGTVICSLPTQEPDVYYFLIKDNSHDEYNDKIYLDGYGNTIMYAEIRKSIECNCIEE